MTSDVHPRVVEIFLTWGAGGHGCVLATKYVREGESFVVGEAEGADALVPAEVLGRDSATLVTWDGAPVVVPIRRSFAWVDGGAVAAEPIALEALDPGSVVDVSIGLFTLRARLVEAATENARDARGAGVVDRAGARGLAFSATMHALAIVLLAVWRPGVERIAAEIEHEASATRQHLLAASAQREAETPVRPRRWRGDDPARGRAPVEPTPVRTATRPTVAVEWPPVAVAGPLHESVPSSRARDRTEAAGVGASFEELLKVDPNEPNPWKDAVASLDGHAAQTKALFADDSPEQWGIGGVTLSGVGEGATTGAAIPLANVGGVTADGIQAQIAAMDPNGFGHVPNVRRGGPPVVSHPDQLPTERIPASVIAGVIRANAGRFGVCLGIGLRRNPELAGRVDVAFTIGLDGAVTDAHDDGGELADESVRACVVKTVFALRFPPPPRGRPMRTTYPFELGSRRE